MKSIYILSCLLIFQSNLFAQTIPALATGKKVPKELMSYLTRNIKQRDRQLFLKGKIIILDFWALGCIPCFHEFPKLESLQSKYKNDIQIISVTMDDNKRIQAYFNKYGKRMNIRLPNLPLISNDSLLYLYFPHTFVPHIVWINKDGTFIAATSGTELTEKKVSELINEKKVALIKKTDVLNENLDIPMRKQDFMDSYFQYSTTFARYVPGGLSQYGFKIDKETGQYRLYFYNIDIVNIMKIAYGETLVNNPFVENPKRIISRVNGDVFDDPNSENTKLHNEWLAEYFINYEIDVPIELKDSIFSFLRKDMERILNYYYNIKCSIKYKYVNCYSLVQVDSLNRFKSKSLIQSLSEYSPDSIFEMKGQLLISLLRGLRYVHKDDDIFFQDNTNFNGLADIVIPKGLGDLNEVSAALRAVGLGLIHKKKQLKFLTFTYLR